MCIILTGTIKYQPYLLEGSFINWELRYPVKILGATRGKFYVARFIDETHIGFLGREMTLGGSVFDLRMDSMFASQSKAAQFVMDILAFKKYLTPGLQVPLPSDQVPL